MCPAQPEPMWELQSQAAVYSEQELSGLEWELQLGEEQVLLLEEMLVLE
jgi:hypothetical protein